MIWTVKSGPSTCGSCGRAIPAFEALAILTRAKLIRCPACAGVPVNEVEIDLERDRLLRERQPRELQPAARERWTPLRDVLPFDQLPADLPFDAKVAALNERE